jgi:hypothetical protein
MTITKSTLSGGEDYASLADILAADDMPADTVTVWGWTANGAPLKLRVHGLSLAQREEARANSWKPDGSRDTVELLAWYFHYGIAAPTMDLEQARMLVKKHAGTVEQIGDYISRLTEMDYAAVTAIAAELARADDATRDEAKPAGRSRKAA